MQISPGYEQKAVLTKAHMAAVTTATNGALTDGGGGGGRRRALRRRGPRADLCRHGAHQGHAEGAWKLAVCHNRP